MRFNARMALIIWHYHRIGLTMPLNEDGFVSRVAIRHSVSPDAVRTILRALRSGGGRMAQFSHPDFGGMSQWSRGMTMVGDMFNDALKSKLDAVCSELATYVAETPSRGIDREAVEVSYRSAKHGANWWPGHLGTPSSVGVQNDLSYAVFPRRLVIKDGDSVEIYDTGDHRIFGVAQAHRIGRGPSTKRRPNPIFH